MQNWTPLYCHRSATFWTTYHRVLSQHDKLWLTPVKELHYFDKQSIKLGALNKLTSSGSFQLKRGDRSEMVWPLLVLASWWMVCKAFVEPVQGEKLQENYSCLCCNVWSKMGSDSFIIPRCPVNFCDARSDYKNLVCPSKQYEERSIDPYLCRRSYWAVLKLSLLLGLITSMQFRWLSRNLGLTSCIAVFLSSS